MRERNLEGSPNKYFTVPPSKEIDCEAHSTLMEQIVCETDSVY